MISRSPHRLNRQPHQNHISKPNFLMSLPHLQYLISHTNLKVSPPVPAHPPRCPTTEFLWEAQHSDGAGPWLCWEAHGTAVGTEDWWSLATLTCFGEDEDKLLDFAIPTRLFGTWPGWPVWFIANGFRSLWPKRLDMDQSFLWVAEVQQVKHRASTCPSILNASRTGTQTNATEHTHTSAHLPSFWPDSIDNLLYSGQLHEILWHSNSLPGVCPQSSSYGTQLQAGKA